MLAFNSHLIIEDISNTDSFAKLVHLVEVLYNAGIIVLEV